MQFGAFSLGEFELEDLLDTVLADDTGHTDGDVLHAILAFEGCGAGDHLLLVLDDRLGYGSSGGTRSHPGTRTEQTGQRCAAYHRTLDYVLQLLLAQELAHIDTFVGRVARQRNHRRVAVTADNEAVHVVGVALQSLAQEVFETGAIEGATHADHAVARQLERVERQVRHRVHRVRYHYEDSVRAVLEHLVANALHDTGVDTDQLLTGHTRLTGQTARDDHDVRTARLAVIVRHTLYHGIKAHELGGLHDIHRLALGKTLFDINQTYFVGDLIDCQHVRARGSYVACAYYCYFTHCFYILYR